MHLDCSISALRRWRARWWLYDRHTASNGVFFFELAAYLLATVPLALAIILPPIWRGLGRGLTVLLIGYGQGWGWALHLAGWAWGRYQVAQAQGQQVRQARALPRATRRGDDVVVTVTVRRGRAA